MLFDQKNIYTTLAVANANFSDIILSAVNKENHIQYIAETYNGLFINESDIFTSEKEWITSLNENSKSKYHINGFLKKYDILKVLSEADKIQIKNIENKYKKEYPENCLQIINVPLKNLIENYIVPYPFVTGTWKSNEGFCHLTYDRINNFLKSKNECNYMEPHEWYFLSLDEATDYHSHRVAKLIQEKDQTPILIDKDENGCLFLMDGHHRVASCLFQKQSHISIAFKPDILLDIQKLEKPKIQNTSKTLTL